MHRLVESMLIIQNYDLKGIPGPLGIVDLSGNLYKSPKNYTCMIM